MEDDRVMLVERQLVEYLAKEVTYLNDVPKLVLELVCQAMPWNKHFDAFQLRAKALQVAYVSLAYVAKKVFQETDHYPWKLPKGNIELNLSHLKTEEKPDI